MTNNEKVADIKNRYSRAKTIEYINGVELLLSELEKLQRRFDMVKQVRDYWSNKCSQETERADRLQKENRQLREDRTEKDAIILALELLVGAKESKLQSAQQEISHYKSWQPNSWNAAQREQKLIEGLREIDTHIRSTHEPLTYIIQTLKRVLPEYGEVTE